MAVVRVAAFSKDVNSATLTITVAAPAALGDYGVAVLSHGATGITYTTVPAGWSLIGSAVSTSSQTFTVYGKTLAAGDIGNLTWVSSVTGKQAGVLGVYSGVNASSAVGGFLLESSNAASASRTSPPLTSTGLNLEAMASKAADPPAWTPPASHSLAAEVHQVGAGAVTLALADSTTDLNGSNAWTLPVSTSQYQALSLWLNAAGATGPTASASLGQGATGPQFRTAVSNQINAASVPVTIPTGAAQPGDVALAWHTFGLTGLTHTAPAGWIQEGPAADTSSQSTALFRKTLVAGDIGSPLTFGVVLPTGVVGGKQAVSLAAYYRVDPSNPIGGVGTNVFDGTVASTTRTSPTIAGVSRVIEAAVAKGADPGAWTPPPAPAFTARTSVAQIGSGAVTMAVADSTTDLNGADTWTTPVALTQGAVWALWLTPTASTSTAVEPYTTVNFVGSGSPPPGATITSYAWAWVSGGTAMTLTGTGPNRTGIAPATLAGVTQVYRLTVTDSNAATATSDVTVVFLSASDTVVSGGVQVPVQMMVATP